VVLCKACVEHVAQQQKKKYVENCSSYFSSILLMEAARSSERLLLFCQAAQCLIPKAAVFKKYISTCRIHASIREENFKEACKAHPFAVD
jgi:hypothetical protein